MKFLNFVAFYQRADLTKADKKPEHLLVLITSDRGLCGAVHSNISRMVKADIQHHAFSESFKIVCVGDKSKAQLQK